MNIYWVIVFAIIWISTTIGAIALDTGEVYVAAVVSTIIWAVIMGVVVEMGCKKDVQTEVKR